MARAIVVGGGAAGLMAACAAAQGGSEVLLLERNEKLGKKIYITGKGRCNFTNAAEDFFANVPRNPRFLYSAQRAWNNADTIRFFEELGVPSVTERGGRVFPASQKASDITRALEKHLRALGVQVLLGDRVSELLVEEGRIAGLRTQGGQFDAAAVILATGGASYPSTGSTGDGYALAESCGHTVHPPFPALIPMETAESWPGTLSGLTLKNVKLTALQNGKKFFEEQGEMLFTHFGVSGPLVLSASCYSSGDAGIELRVDLKPALSAEQLDARILRDFEGESRRQFKNALAGLLPGSLIPIVVALSGIPPELPVNQLTRAQRQAFVSLLKALPMHVARYRPLDEAIITRGGVDVKQINPSTMESKLVGGLYFAGEVIDVDALTGGFNMQIAFSTGYLAGSSVKV